MNTKTFELSQWIDGALHGCERLENGFRISFEWRQLSDEPQGFFEISVYKQGRDYLKSGNLVLVNGANVSFKEQELKTNEHGDAQGDSDAPVNGDRLAVSWDDQEYAFEFQITKVYQESQCMHCAHRAFYSPNRAMLERSNWACECTGDDVFESTENPNEHCENFLDESTTTHRAGMFRSILTLAKEAWIDGSVTAAEQLNARLESGNIK